MELENLASDCRIVQFEHYAEIVIEKSRLRAIRRLANSLQARAEDQTESADEIVVDTDRQLLEVIAENTSIWPDIEVKAHAAMQAILDEAKASV